MNRNITSEDIKRSLINLFSTHNYKLTNTFLFGWESDFLSFTKANYCHEVEIKISKSDFYADFKKEFWNNRNKLLKHGYLSDDTKIDKPNKFSFACPEGLITINDLPDKRYGLYYMSPFSIVREPKFLHKENLFDSKIFVMEMMKKFYYRNLDLMRLNDIRMSQIKWGQSKLY